MIRLSRPGILWGHGFLKNSRARGYGSSPDRNCAVRARGEDFALFVSLCAD